MKSYVDGYILASMPDEIEGFFDGSVVYVGQHDARGALGFVVNKPSEIPMPAILDQLGIPYNHAVASKIPVYAGGPVAPEKGFLLHQCESLRDGSDMPLKGCFATSSRKALERVSKETILTDFLFVLGYSGWSKGQLEGEIARNSWLYSEIDSSILFGSNAEEKWSRCMKKVGVRPSSLTEMGYRYRNRR